MIIINLIPKILELENKRSCSRVYFTIKNECIYYQSTKHTDYICLLTRLVNKNEIHRHMHPKLFLNHPPFPFR